MALTKKAFPLVLLLLLLSVPSSAAKEAAPAMMSLDECIERALAGHPDLAAGRADMAASEARTGQIRAGYSPSMSFSSGFSERSSPGSGSSEGSWSSGLTLSQVVSDWGRTHISLRRSLLDAEGKALALEAKRSDIIFEVTRSYYQVLKTMKNLEVAEESLALNDERLGQAEAFFEVGRVSKYDVTAARVSRSNASLALVQAGTALKEAMTSLKAAIGSPGMPDFSLAEVADGQGSLPPTSLPLLEVALDYALGNRPDLEIYRVNLASAEAAATLAGLDNAPKLDLSAGYGWGSTDFWGQDSWRAGLTLSFHLFDGGLRREKIREAGANVEGAEARLESYRQQVMKDVTNAWLAASDSAEAEAAAAEGLKMASENLEIATGRYRTGVGSPLEVSDATKNFAEAKAAWYGALYDGMTARAALEKAMGVER